MLLKVQEKTAEMGGKTRPRFHQNLTFARGYRKPSRRDQNALFSTGKTSI
ncbi:hypothetical protein U91I_03180 [alpha proteobacterium U9-1i]|nr:hypothetical protein U91I_03180 [alpha proteobacterium U9-1i]